MANFFKDNDDLRFYFDTWIDWESLARITERDYKDPDGFKNVAEAKEFYADVADMFGQIAGDEIAPFAKEIEDAGMELVDGEVIFPKRLQGVFDQIAALGFHGMCLPRELGGMNVPLIVYYMGGEMIARADVGTMTHHSFHGGMAMAMLVYSIYEGTTTFDANGFIQSTRFADYIAEIGTGEAWGCMDITEPDAGSDMAALRTRAEQDDDGNWFLTGQKIFITSGHGKYHFVVARTDRNGELGLEGLSFFLVKAYDDNADGTRTRHATVGRLEEKLGHHSSATCQIHFERTPAVLVGKIGEGFKQMLILMNNARIGVSTEGLGIAEAALRMARDYAAERRSMGKTIDRHEMIADTLDEMDAQIRGMRALVMHGAYHEELANKLMIMREAMTTDGSPERAELDRDINHHKYEARRVTPLMKYITSEKAVEFAKRAIVLHGGVGYTTEYGVEKLLRDAMVLPIYEGTSQIQSLMAMKDTLGAIMKNPQRFVREMAQARWRSLSARDPLERRVAGLRWLSDRAQQTLLSRTAADKFKSIRHRPMGDWADSFTQNWDPKRDFAFAMLHAERLTRMLCDTTIVELLWEQARKHPERRELLERFLERAEPRCRAELDAITNTGERMLALLARGEEARQAAE